MEEYEILEELKMHIRCSEFAQKLFCDGVSVDFLKSTLDLILKQKAEIEKNKAARNASVSHGYWTQVDENKCRCSKCYIIALISLYPHGDKNFCPNCGAKMDEEESDR